MHFVINVFVTAVCFISIILFKEILNKIVKVLLSVIANRSSADGHGM